MKEIFLFMRPLRSFLCVFMLLSSGLVSAFSAEIEPLKIMSKNGTIHTFQVEVARTGEERQKGLMFREKLDNDKGMIFEFSPPQVIHMWMKNTYISLDMLFIRKDGVIVRITERAKPESEMTISSGEAVSGVLEIAGGRARELNILPGDKVEHGFFTEQE